MTEPSSLEPGRGDATRTGARGALGFLAVVVVLSGCARFETSHDTARTLDGSGAGDAVTRRPSEAYHQIILRDADSRGLSPVLAGGPQGGFNATPRTLGAGTVSPSGPGAVTARRPAEAPLSFPLYFALDSDRLTAAGQTAIDAAVTAARKIGATDFAVTGYVGLVGPEAHNVEPSLRRAKVVSAALAARGIDPARINVANQVEVEPIVATAGGLGELASRRVDIILLKQD